MDASAQTTEPEDFRRKFRDRLIEARQAAGMTGAELATKAGTSPAQVSRWESGLYVPKLYWVSRLARALGIEASALIPDQQTETEDLGHEHEHELGGEG